MIKKRRIILLILIVMIVIIGVFWKILNAKESVKFPQTDIVYQAINKNLGNETSNNLLGFINIDGSENLQTKLKFRPYNPVMSKDLGGIFFRVNKSMPNDLFQAEGTIYFLNENGKYEACDQLLYSDFIFPIKGTKNILVSDMYHIDIVNIDTCKVDKILVEIPKETPWINFIGSAYPSNSGKSVIFHETYRSPIRDVIYLVDINSGKVTEILEGGFNPSFSPDDQKIAYIGDEDREGLYIANADGTQAKLIVPFTLYFYHNLEPYPFWSPDGGTIIYHKCNNEVCKDLSDFSIYKVEVKSGLEQKIFDGGLYPTWIK
jgi:WD40-like Beta Propeller Repeat